MEKEIIFKVTLIKFFGEYGELKTEQMTYTSDFEWLIGEVEKYYFDPHALLKIEDENGNKIPLTSFYEIITLRRDLAALQAFPGGKIETSSSHWPKGLSEKS